VAEFNAEPFIISMMVIIGHYWELPPFDLARLLTSTLTDRRYLIFRLMLEESSALTSTTPAAAVTGDQSDDEVQIISDSSSPYAAVIWRCHP
jgi:hypothetical protein